MTLPRPKDKSELWLLAGYALGRVKRQAGPYHEALNLVILRNFKFAIS